jgi:hypothetical protein
MRRFFVLCFRVCLFRRSACGLTGWLTLAGDDVSQ